MKDHGYLIQYKFQDIETKRFYYEYEVCDDPHVDFQHVGSVEPDGGFSTCGFFHPLVLPQVENHPYIIIL